MKKLDVHFSSEKMDWETPQKFFNVLNDEYDFTLDVASNGSNAKTEKYFTKEDDGLTKEWKGRVFCNPPYGREIKHWVKKAYDESKKDYNDLIVLLIPSRTDTKYWHDFIFNKASKIIFLKGRLKFEVNGESTNSAPFPSAIVVYKGDKTMTIDTM